MIEPCVSQMAAQGKVRRLDPENSVAPGWTTIVDAEVKVSGLERAGREGRFHPLRFRARSYWVWWLEF